RPLSRAFRGRIFTRLCCLLVLLVLFLGGSLSCGLLLRGLLLALRTLFFRLGLLGASVGAFRGAPFGGTLRLFRDLFFFGSWRRRFVFPCRRFIWIGRSCQHAGARSQHQRDEAKSTREAAKSVVHSFTLSGAGSVCNTQGQRSLPTCARAGIYRY